MSFEEFVCHKGWQLGPIYTDAGLSGRLDQRPALRQLLRDASVGRFDVVVVHAIDRFYRSLAGLLTAIELLNRHSVGFVSITENLDFTTPWGKLPQAVPGTLAEIYIDKISAETKKGKRERTRKGHYNGSIPFGYCNGCCSDCTDPNGPGYCPHAGQLDWDDGERLIAHPIEAVGVRRAYKLSATGLYTDRNVADLINTPLNAIIAAGFIIKNFQTLWEKNDNNLKKQMLRALLAALTVQGDALSGWQPNSAFYPLLKHALSPFWESSCYSGSDGT